MYKSVKVRIYPNAKQQAILRQHIGHSRAIYNMGLRYCIWEYHAALERDEKPKSPSHFNLTSWLTDFKKNDDVAWLNDVPVNVLGLSLERLARAYKNFFQRRTQGVGFPYFKGRWSPQTARYSRTVRVSECGRYVTLPPRDVGWIKMRGWRPEFVGVIKTCTVRLAPSGRWYFSIMMDDGVEKAKQITPKSPHVVALHCGLSDYVTMFDGIETVKIINPKLLDKAQANLKRKDRKLSRKIEAAKRTKIKDSGLREKARIQRARAYERLANARMDHINKLAKSISASCDVLIIETWGIKEMMGNKVFAKRIADSGWAMLQEKLKQKMNELGGEVVVLDRFFASSLICSTCGVKANSVPLSAINWTCEYCGERHDRNENAAKNIYSKGLIELSAAGSAVAATGG